MSFLHISICIVAFWTILYVSLDVHALPSGSRHVNVYKGSTVLSVQPFNPFTARNKNTNVKWFEADLEKFYTFVENQPLLTAEQETSYGKALRMWMQVEQKWEKLRLENATAESGATNVTLTNLSVHLGCSEATLEKMEKLAEIARLKLINSNLRLVLAVVSRYRTADIPNSELIAEGTRGLSKAVLRYDYSKGFRFATYATWYVHQAISEYVRWRRHPAKMPSRYLLLLRRVKQFSAQYRAEHRRQPSISEIAAEVKQSHFDVIKVLSMQQYPTLLHSTMQSSNSYKQDGKDRVLEELLPSIYKAPTALSDSKDLRRDMEQMLQLNLNDVERDVLRLRLGLDDGRAKPVKEVGKRFKISWKQVRSVEKEAITKLLHSEEIDGFVKSFESV
jgi:RNA polymerase sigma factor (sigma-70 family)